MFSSNQILQISGDLKHQGELEADLAFVLEKHALSPKNKYPDGYQITADGSFAFACTYGEVKPGWLPFPFKAEIPILAPIIRQHLMAQRFPPGIDGDGSVGKGYLITVDDAGVENNWYLIAVVKPFSCYYAK